MSLTDNFKDVNYRKGFMEGLAVSTIQDGHLYVNENATFFPIPVIASTVTSIVIFKKEDEDNG